MKKTRPQDRITLLLCVLAALVAVLAPTRPAAAQACPEAPVDPQFWVQCGICRGDLNGDGLLDELDLMVFRLYESQVPTNFCADFNDNGVVDIFDEQILRCIIVDSDGACTPECGPASGRSCFEAAIPGQPGGCEDLACCQAVCQFDPACCDLIWDATCVGYANNLCSCLSPDIEPDAGNCLCEHEWGTTTADCLLPNGLPGCSDPQCTEVVCTAEPACCDIAWDSDCAALAADFCQTPCTNLKLQRKVCEILPECCQTGDWDAECTQTAADVIRDQPGLQIKFFPSSALQCVPDCPRKDPDCNQDCQQLFNSENAKNLTRQIQDVQALFCDINPIYCRGTTNFADGLTDCIALLENNFPACKDLFDAGCWDEACVQIASQLCRWPAPGIQGLGNCLVPHEGGGCANAYCNDLVTRLDPSCCQEAWDETCMELAAQVCSLVPAPVYAGTSVDGPDQDYENIDVSGCGSSTAGACGYQNFSPFCEDGACCILVCSYDLYCCETRWDEFCAQLATEGCVSESDRYTCGFKPIAFGPIGRSCFEARPVEAQYLTGCQNADCCNTVCYVDPFCCDVRWDGVCADAALQLCSPFDDLFPGCGDPFAGSCYIPDKQPNCDDTECCQNVCQIDPSCCTQSWDVTCVDLAEVNCVQCGDLFSGSCLSPNGLPGCSDESCCESVCEVDSFCCEVIWDAACVGIARFLDECKLTTTCGTETGRSCYLPSYLPGCSDDDNGTCCTLICTDYDPFCCEARWDDICASQAINYCDPPLPGGTREACNVPHGTPGCNIPECALQVCSVPGYETCCTNRWDADCVQAADAICIGIYQCPGPGDCKTPHPNPLCEDPSCCNVVCTYDPSCCTLEWDTQCATLALQNCAANNSTSDFNCPCEGSCFEAREDDDPRPGCEDTTCCIAVCKIDPACCTINWDSSCASAAEKFCGAPPECGSSVTGSCVESHDTPFCDDPDCCAAICKIDPFCCTDRWDSFCVVYAIDRCQRGCGIRTAGSCFYPHPTPGCSDADCCQAVCEADPICCSTTWDATCATLALGVPGQSQPLCDVPECGDFAAGDPCKPNFSPASNDKRCCNAVCAIDPICCNTSWDLECVRLARTVPSCPCGEDWDCGDPCAGDCCIPNFTPKCNDEDCCDLVCAEDPFCCETEWDLTCATMANTLCNDPDEACPAPQCGDEEAGQCCFGNGTPACNDASCCDDVCDADPICCEVGWDNVCASIAQDICDVCSPVDVECGSSKAGPCDEPHPGPFCSDTEVCECVCLFEPFCCIGDWDESCVFIATELCP